MSACSDNQSTILPFPSSPHWAPTTTTLAISQVFPLQLDSLKHDLRPNGAACPEGKPPPFSGSCRVRASSQNAAGAARMRGNQSDKGCGLPTQAGTGPEDAVKRVPSH